MKNKDTKLYQQFKRGKLAKLKVEQKNTNKSSKVVREKQKSKEKKNLTHHLVEDRKTDNTKRLENKREMKQTYGKGSNSKKTVYEVSLFVCV